jgi:hypothetical protein
MNLSKNAPSGIIAMTLAILISPAQAQTVVSCTSTSYQCCWVIRSWQKMGRTTTVNPASATGCCSNIGDIDCTSTGIVTKISWSTEGLQGQIPAELGKLTSLQYL